MAESQTPPIIHPRLLPWHKDTVAQLQTAWAGKRLPRSLLLQGAEGLGKRDLAAWFGAAVLCERSESELIHCGSCASCLLVAAGTHPDLLWVMPEEDKQQISVDQIRAAGERLTKTSYRQGYKVAIVEPAHQMTTGAANSLLKTLEEPPPRSLLILITHRPSGLPATVRSRCQKLILTRPTPAQTGEWLQAQTGRQIPATLLQFAGGAPLKALQMAEGSFDALNEDMQRSIGSLFQGDNDVTQIASQWAKDSLPERLIWIDLWLGSLARGAIAGSDERFTFPERPAPLPTRSSTLNISAVYRLVDRVRALRSQLSRTALQRELAVESWLIAMLQLFSPPSKDAGR